MKKLQVKKITITNLNEEQLNGLNGGIITNGTVLSNCSNCFQCQQHTRVMRCTTDCPW